MNNRSSKYRSSIIDFRTNDHGIIAHRRAQLIDFIKSSIIKCSECTGFMILILNTFAPPVGTLLSAFLDKNRRCYFNPWALLAFLLQLIFLPLFFIGWIWAISHGFAIWRNNHKGKKHYCAKLKDFHNANKRSRAVSYLQYNY